MPGGCKSRSFFFFLFTLVLGDRRMPFNRAQLKPLAVMQPTVVHYRKISSKFEYDHIKS